MRLKLISLPQHVEPVTGMNVRVVDAKTNEPVHGVEAVYWYCAGRKEPARMLLVVRDVPVEAFADLPAHAAAALMLLKDG